MKSWVRIAAAVLIVALSTFGYVSVVAAQDAEQSVAGRLRVEDATGERVPVEGVVLRIDGQGEATSDADGNWEIPVSEAGTYVVEIDQTTFPEGVSLRDADRGTLEVLVEATEFAAREPAQADLSESGHGMGRELFASFRALAGRADAGASVLYG